jgi:outer membrane protein assembly complex protein YaeT
MSRTDARALCRTRVGARIGAALLAVLLLLLLAAAPAAAAPAPPSPSPVKIEGKLVDPEEALLEAVGLGGGRPMKKGEEERIRKILDTLSYRSSFTSAGGRVTIHVEPYRVVRKIYIKGNWPLFEEEILRRIRFRPGQRLPEGRELTLALDRQEDRMRSFLSREGYFDGSLQIRVKPTDVPHEVNLEVYVNKGRSYKVGDVAVEFVGHGAPTGSEASTLAGARVERPAPSSRPVAEAGTTTAAARSGPEAPGVATTTRAARGLRSMKEMAGEPTSISLDEIGRMFQQKIWFYKRVFNTVRFKEDVEALVQKFHDRGYPGVRIKENYTVDRTREASEAVRISLRIQQRKRIVVHTSGNSALKQAELQKVLTLNDEGNYDDYELAESGRRIHRLYQSQGYLQARVRFTRRVGPGADEVTFQIDEGPRFRVEEVLFAGNESIPADVLRKVIKTRTFPWLGWIGLGEGGYVTDLQVEQDVDRLVKHYREQGFPATRAVPEIAPDPALLGRPGALAAAALSGAVAASRKLWVRFTLFEGPRLTVEEVVIEGNSVLKKDVLLGQLELGRGRPFTENGLALDKARLVRIYSENGHPYATVRSLEEYNLQGTGVTVHLSVQEGPRVRFGHIFTRGNFHTRRSVILNDLRFKKGDDFDIRKLEDGERLMRKREIFNSVRVTPLGQRDQAEVISVLVEIEERYDDYGALEFAIGGSTDNLLFGSIAYTNRNLFGFGTSLTLKGEYGMKIQGGNLLYRDPRLFGSSLIFDAQGFLKSLLTTRLGQIFTFGGSLSLSRELYSKLTGQVRYEIRRVARKEVIYRPAGVDESPQIDLPDTTVAEGIGPVLVYDRRDSPLSPTRGFRLSGSIFWYYPYVLGTDHFLKINLNAQAFIPLPKEMTIAVSVRYDQGIPLGGAVLLPKAERFFAGGDTTIRGLEEDMAWTERIPVSVAPLSGATFFRLLPQGGNIRLLGNLEFQFPIWKESILFGLPLMGALFFDNGVVTNSFQGFSVRSFRQAAGAALRVVTPVGFTSIEYAFCLDPDLGDPKFGRVHFNFGYIF